MANWNKVKLGEIASITSSKRIFAKEYQTEGIPFYRGKEIIEKHNGNNVSTELFITRERYEEIKSKFDVPKPGDILLSSVGTLGVSWLVDEDEFYFKDGNLTWLRCNEKTTPDFLYLWLNSPEAQNQIDAMCIGSTQKALTIETLNKFDMTLPPLDIQQKICDVVYPIADKIKANTAINRNLLEQGRTLFEDLISNRESNAKLENLISNIETGSRPKGGAQTEGIPSIGAEKIECFGVYDYASEKYISEEYFDKLKKGHISSGDVLLYKDGAYTGKSSMALDGFPHDKCAINEHVFKLNTENNNHQFFLYFTLDNKSIREYIYTLASSKAAQPGLNQVELLGTEIVLPDKNELELFEAQVSDMMHRIALNAKENKKLADLRDGLLPKLMSGELDVSDLEI